MSVISPQHSQKKRGAKWEVDLLLPVIVLLFLILPAIARAELFLEYAGSLDIPHDTYVGGTKVGGLSGITYDEDREVYYAVADSPNFGSQRFYTFKIDFDKSGKPSAARVIGVTRLRDANGKPISTCDTEGMAFDGSKSVWISNEGNERAKANPNPWIKKFALGSGKENNRCRLPEEFMFKAAPDDPDTSIRGVFNNQSLESLAITPDRKFLYTANELALVQDRNESVMRVRIVQFSEKKDEWQPSASKAYQISPGGFFHSLSDLTCIDSGGKLLALERYINGFSLVSDNFGFSVYEVDFNESGTTNVLGVNVMDSKVKPLTKQLVFNSEKAGVPACDNVEGMCLGPVVKGRKTLILISDDNFQLRQITRIHVLLFPKN